MIVTYKNRELEKVCTNFSKAIRKYGLDMARKIHMRIGEILAATDVETMIKFGIGRCHPLEGSREGQYAMDLVQPYRLVFTVVNGKIQIAKIIEIVDYH